MDDGGGWYQLITWELVVLWLVGAQEGSHPAGHSACPRLVSLGATSPRHSCPGREDALPSQSSLKGSPCSSFQGRKWSACPSATPEASGRQGFGLALGSVVQ